LEKFSRWRGKPSQFHLNDAFLRQLWASSGLIATFSWAALRHSVRLTSGALLGATKVVMD